MIVERDYSLWGLLYLIWGGTSVPTQVSFRCPKCADIFEVSTPELHDVVRLEDNYGREDQQP